MIVNFRPGLGGAGAATALGAAAGGRAVVLAGGGWAGAARCWPAGGAGGGAAGTGVGSAETSAAPQAMQKRPAGCATGAPQLGQVVGDAISYSSR